MLEYLLDMEFLGEQDRNSYSNELEIKESRGQAVTETDLRGQIAQLESRVGELNLLCTALVRALVQSKLLFPKELARSIREVDLEDGHADGQHHPDRPQVPQWCPKCEARIPPGRTSCMFCGKSFQEGVLEAQVTKPKPSWIAPPECPDCGSKNPSDARSCSYCGVRFGN